jgi:hypothetical protein
MALLPSCYLNLLVQGAEWAWPIFPMPDLRGHEAKPGGGPG